MLCQTGKVQFTSVIVYMKWNVNFRNRKGAETNHVLQRAYLDTPKSRRSFRIKFSEDFHNFKYTNNKSKFAQHLWQNCHCVGPTDSTMKVLYCHCVGPTDSIMKVLYCHCVGPADSTMKVLYCHCVGPTDSTMKPTRVHCVMFFWPYIMNWLYINYQLDALIIIYS